MTTMALRWVLTWATVIVWGVLDVPTPYSALFITAVWLGPLRRWLVRVLPP